MKQSIYIAWKYIIHNRLKTIILTACITIILFLPLALEMILNESENQLLSRADATPLLVGAKGSALDLCMNSLYFDDELPELATMVAVRKVEESGLAIAVPVHNRFSARGFPVIGTSLDYFEQRRLDVGDGRFFGLIGECVIGSTVAEDLEVQVGEGIVTSPESLFDIAGVYPLKMKVVGILNSSHSPDDLGIFVDIKTTWIIQGLGHGHQDVTAITDPTLIYGRNDSLVTATPKLMHYNEITEENLESFHFHGSTDVYPITAVLVFPHDQKSGTILRGRYLKEGEIFQILKPTEIIDGLLQNIFRIRNVLDAVITIVAVATLMAMVLVFALSLRLRTKEIQTIFKLGCRKGTIVRLLLAEILLILASSIVLCTLMLIILSAYSSEIVRLLFFG